MREEENDMFLPNDNGLLNRGEMELEDLDDANIPVDIWLAGIGDSDFPDNLKNEGYRYRLRCGAYMPRKASVYEGAVEVYSKDRETMQKAIEKYIMPFYQVAMNKIRKMAETGEGHLYYWE